MAGNDLLTRMPLDYEPLRVNRWLLRFPDDIGINECWLSKASRPKYKSEDTSIDFLNTKTHVIGKYEWESITVSVRETIAPSTTQAIMEWVRLHSESLTGRQGYAAGYKRDLELEMLDPAGHVVQKWIMKNCMVTGANFGELNYTSSDLAQSDMTIVMDYAILVY